LICSACTLNIPHDYSKSSQWPLGAAFIAFLVMIPISKILEATKQFDLFHFSFVILIAILARSIGNYEALSTKGLTASLWAIIFGFVARTIGINILDKSKLTTIEGSSKKKSYYSGEFFVKIGVVLLAMDLTSIWKNGLNGLVVAWLDTLIVFVTGTFICRKLFDIQLEKSIIVAGATSICGSSAAQALTASIGKS